MLAYWLLFAVAAIPALLPARPRARNLALWLGVGLVLVIAIGFRYQVGGDWSNYLRMYDTFIGTTLADALSAHGSDPGYVLLNWAMARLGWGIYGVNAVCGAIFAAGLVVFCRQQPASWLGLAVAVPYLVVVMAMGYTRQSVALGLFFLALAAIQRGQFWPYLACVALAATFHKSAVLLFPLGVFLYGQGWTLRAVAVAVAAYGFWVLLLEEHQEGFWVNYVDSKMESQGARIRVWMNVVPSLLVLLYAKRWKRLFPDFAIWFFLAAASLVSLALVGYATTAVDRMSLYFTPMQVAVFARLPALIRQDLHPELVRLGVVTAYGGVLFVWLNYASHAIFWVPYRNILLE